jgi:RNA polymerase sigma factor (sigma-70 family)
MIIRGVSREWKPERAAVTVSLDEPAFGEVGRPRPAPGTRGPASVGGQPVSAPRALAPGSGERLADRVADSQDLERQFLDGEARMVVRSALQQLSASGRHLIERRFYEEMPVGELAKELGMTRQGVYQREKRVLRQLHAALSASLSGD